MNDQILREQIVELTKLLELKDLRIKELEALRSIPNVVLPFTNQTSNIDNFEFKCENSICTCGKISRSK